MWPFKRKKKSAREDLKQVYFYKGDYITLKSLSKQAKTSMTKLVHDILEIYLGYKYGVAEGNMKRLELQRNLLAEELKKNMEALKLYKNKFGDIVT